MSCDVGGWWREVVGGGPGKGGGERLQRAFARSSADLGQCSGVSSLRARALGLVSNGAGALAEEAESCTGVLMAQRQLTPSFTQTHWCCDLSWFLLSGC